MKQDEVKKLVAEMTLEEKAGLCSGKDFWRLKSVERLGVPEVMVCDGPNGLRKQKEEGTNVNESIEAVCFPGSCAEAASFDRDTMYRAGQAMGNACQAENISMLLGPGVNIKRSPICGRNFEYYSEDPYLAGQIAAAHINGVQSKGVGACIKHFAANNQETRRMSVSAEVDERTLREIYLAAFEEAVKEAKPWGVMCSYNQINGVFSSENKWLLHDVLKDEWGYEGLVVTDWGAVNDRVQGLLAGLDLEMPGSGGTTDVKIVEAVQNGQVPMAVLDDTCERIMNFIMNYTEQRDKEAVWDKEADHKLAVEAAKECMVLLKNEDQVLPLSEDQQIAFIGKFAEHPRYQGGGSSHVNTKRPSSALEQVKTMEQVRYVSGFDTKEAVGEEAERLEKQRFNDAIAAATQAEVAVIFAGLPDAYESEGFDRKHMRLPEIQNRLIQAVAEVQPNTIVVLHNGSPVEMPWIHSVKAVLETYLGGEGVGEAVVDILFGRANPSGKLPETFPLKLSDNPSYLNFPGDAETVEYKEGIYVGYRYYDKKEMEVLFPFGHGLSYTTFRYSNLSVDKKRLEDEDELQVSVTITNTGERYGKEAVQLYVQDVESRVSRPVKELKGFEKVALEPGESKIITFILNKRAWAYYDVEAHDWYTEEGTFKVLVGASSRDIRMEEAVYVIPVKKPKHTYSLNTVLGDLYENEMVKEEVAELKRICDSLFDVQDGILGEGMKDMMEAQTREMPLKSLPSFSDGKVTREYVEKIVAKLNR